MMTKKSPKKVNDPYLYLSALISGLVGSAHCMGMCGGVASALALGVERKGAVSRFAVLFSYNIGRISTYFFLGILAGTLGLGITGAFSPNQATLMLRVIAGAMMIAMGLYVAGWWFGIQKIEKAGGLLWSKIQPFTSKLMPVKNPTQALLLGLLWGFLPCGLVYSAMTLAVTAGDWQGGATVMFAFGLGTLPSMLAAGVFANAVKSLLQKRVVKQVAALTLIGFGVWTIAVPLQHAFH